MLGGGDLARAVLGVLAAGAGIWLAHRIWHSGGGSTA